MSNRQCKWKIGRENEDPRFGEKSTITRADEYAVKSVDNPSDRHEERED
uniref:Uncharacterized protein n=1 Tax=uncultured bacterium A1Q1_fos_324 TaxID=1256572 RepID=L7VUY1_9BACT|nr:hypothetical protein [uncultured bacterium A1Q1_fos_324]